MKEPSIFSATDDVPALKTKYAEALLREPDNAFKAACTVFGSDTGRALYAASKWLNDEFVLHEKSRLLQGKGARSFLPTKEDYARELWTLATNERTPIEDRTRLFSLFGDAMGYREAPSKNTGGITINNNKVLLVRDFGNDAAWEAKAAAQQHQLTNIVDVPATIQ